MRRLILILWLAATPAFAVNPDEMLADPVLEARAQALDEELRCVKCRSENIASSHADWARDARLLVRDLIAEGKSDGEVLDFFVARYGDYVLMRPRAEGANWALWLAAPGMLLLGGGIALYYLRGRASVPSRPDALSDAERARVAELMGE